MVRLPVLKARDIIAALEKAGFEMVRSRGSHRIYQHRDDPKRRAVVPYHGSQDMPRGTLKSILAQAGLSDDDFIALL